MAEDPVAEESDDVIEVAARTPAADPERTAEPVDEPAGRTARKSKRAAVPSWDDILFGSRSDTP